MILVVAGPPSVAEEVTGDQLRSLAQQALTDPAALERLRGVESVDGSPVNMRTALGDARGDDLEARLRTLSSGASAISDPDDVRDAARRIVASAPYTDSQLPRPFRGALRWLGERLEPVLDVLGRPFAWAADRIPGGWTTVWGLIGVLIVGAAAVVTTGVLRRSRVSAAQRQMAVRGEKLDPRRIERDAEEAERRGDLEAAIRLRFLAGLLRLDDAGRLEFDPSLTTGEVGRRIRVAPFRELGRTHDEIVYGRRPAQPVDVESTRRAWTRVFEEVGSR